MAMFKRTLLITALLLLILNVLVSASFDSRFPSTRQLAKDGSNDKRKKNDSPEMDSEDVVYEDDDDYIDDADDEDDFMYSMSMSMKHDKVDKVDKGEKGKGKNKPSSSRSYKDKDDKKDKYAKDKKQKDKKEKDNKKEKGEKGGKKGGTKGSKKDKGGKDKGGKDKGGKDKGDKVKPPVLPPFSISDVTPSPTSANSIPIRVSPYSLLYDINGGNVPSSAEFREVGEVTRFFLEYFMTQEFGQTSLTNLDDFLTVMVRNSFTSGNPVQIEFRSTGLFNPSSIFLPTVRELDGLITQAFTGEYLDAYVDLLGDLPGDNPFSDTKSVELSTPIIIPRTKDSTASRGNTAPAIGASAAAIVVLAVGAIVLRGRRKNAEDCDGTFVGGKHLSDDTVADETCTMSLCASSDVHSWMPSKNSTDRRSQLHPRENRTAVGDREDGNGFVGEDDRTYATDFADEDSVSGKSGPPMECFLPASRGNRAIPNSA